MVTEDKKDFGEDVDKAEQIIELNRVKMDVISQYKEDIVNSAEYMAAIAENIERSGTLQNILIVAVDDEVYGKNMFYKLIHTEARSMAVEVARANNFIYEAFIKKDVDVMLARRCVHETIKKSGLEGLK